MNVNAYTVRNGDFTEKIDVICPKCGDRALVVGARVDAPAAEYEERVRFACAACGYAVKYGNTPKFTAFINSRGRPVRGRMLLLNTTCDPFFGFRLWYIIETPYGTLWAYNLDHLAVIERCIVANRLPPWVKEARHRALLLKLIARWKG